MGKSLYEVSANRVGRCLRELAAQDADTTAADYIVKRYYLNGGTPVWVDRYGADSRADTLIETIAPRIDTLGFSRKAFYISSIQTALSDIRALRIDTLRGISATLAELDYRLTKAYMRYLVGSKYGFTNPKYMFNRLDADETDSITGKPLSFRRLFDIDNSRPGNGFTAQAISAARSDTLGDWLRSAESADPLYQTFKESLRHTKGRAPRLQLLCNMERARWRYPQRGSLSGKHVFVNIPAQRLYAYCNDSTLEMRVCYGAFKTKTPILVSQFSRIEVNPVWNVPMSVIRKEISHHATDTSYFARNRFAIYDRTTDEEMSPETVTAAMFTSGNYRVVQQKGDGNSLGRLIFRFDNNFSVYLHDTSNKGAFDYNHRGVSHGCIRIEKPYEFALYLSGEADDWTIDKLRISIDLPPLTARGKKFIDGQPESTTLIHSLPIAEPTPVLIGYFTIYPDLQGRLQAYPDVYGYDKVIGDFLQPYLQESKTRLSGD